MSKIPMFPNKFAILASILGGIKDEGTPSDILAYVDRPSCCYINSAYHQENTPCSYGVCVKFPMSYSGVKHVIALAVDYENSTIYTNIRWSGSWMGWQTNPNGIPAFYKDYANLSSLASALGVINLEHFPLNADMNSYSGLRFFEQSNSQVIVTMTNLPPNVTGGEIQAIVLSHDGYGVQILFHSSAGKVYIRFERGTGNFTSWNEWY